ncbi:MAG: hypothetical protein V1860_04010 [bacterium]
MKKELRIVSLDGISGTGKSQIMRYLMGYYAKKYSVMGFSENLISPERETLACKVLSIREDKSLSGDEKKYLEDKLFTEIASDDRAYISRTFIPFAAQANADLLFLDRWYPTNMAYQSLGRLTPEEILKLHRDKNVAEPDIYIILTCPAEIASKRVDMRTTKMVRGVAGKMSTVRSKDGEIDLAASLEKKRRIQDQFLKLPPILGHERCLVVDTAGNITDVLKELTGKLNIKLFGKPLDIPSEFPAWPFDNQVISG